MKKPIVIYAWLVSCAAAFGLGSFLKSGSPDRVAESAGGVTAGPLPSVAGGAPVSGPKVRGTRKATAERLKLVLFRRTDSE